MSLCTRRWDGAWNPRSWFGSTRSLQSPDVTAPQPCLAHDTHTEHRRTTGRYAVDCVAHPCWLQTGRNRIGPDVPTVRQNRPSCRRRWSCCRCHRCPTASSSGSGALPCRLPPPPHCCQPPTKPALCTHTHLRFFATDALNVSKLDSLRGLSPPPETFSECRPLTPGTREPSPTEAALWRRRFSLRWCRTRRLVDRFEAVGAACKLCGKPRQRWSACAWHEWDPSIVPHALWCRIVRHLEAHKIRHPLFGAKAKRLRGVDAH